MKLLEFLKKMTAFVWKGTKCYVFIYFFLVKIMYLFFWLEEYKVLFRAPLICSYEFFLSFLLVISQKFYIIVSWNHGFFFFN